MVDAEVPSGQHFLQVPEAEPEPQVPTDAQDNDLGFEMSAFKQCRAVRSHPPQGTRHPPPTGLQHFQSRHQKHLLRTDSTAASESSAHKSAPIAAAPRKL